MLGVGHRVHGNLLAVLRKGLMLAEIYPADQLPHNDKINPLVHNAFFQRGGICQLRPDAGRTVVGIQPHTGAQAQKPFFGAAVAGQPLPLGTADGTQQHTVSGFAFFQLGGGQRVAELVDRLTAHIGAGVGEGVVVFVGNFVQHTHCLPDNFRAGAVAVNQGNGFVHGCFPLNPSGCSSSRPWQ